MGTGTLDVHLHTGMFAVSRPYIREESEPDRRWHYHTYAKVICDTMR